MPGPRLCGHVISTNRSVWSMAPTAALQWGRSSRALTVGEQANGTCGRGVRARVSTRITGHPFPAPRKGGRSSGPATAGEQLMRCPQERVHCSSGVCALCPRAVGQGATLEDKNGARCSMAHRQGGRSAWPLRADQASPFDRRAGRYRDGTPNTASPALSTRVGQGCVLGTRIERANTEA